MQYKTSGIEFETFGSVYEQAIDVKNEGFISMSQNIPAKRYADILFYFYEEVFIELEAGIAALLVSFDSEPEHIETFAIHRFIRLKPNVYFNIMAISPNASFKIISRQDYKFASKTLEPPYKFNRVLPSIHIDEILGYYYNIRNSGYKFKGERHNYYELTFVDRGTLITEVEGQCFKLREKELMIYGPG